jgi:hypothetical protein
VCPFQWTSLFANEPERFTNRHPFEWMHLFTQMDTQIQRESPIEPCNFLNLCIPMPLTHLSNVAKGKYFVNRLARLSHDLICKILISRPSCNLCQ